MSKPAFKGQVAALVREFAKDVNSTLHQVFFNQPVGPSELGTPLSPTQKDVNEDLKPKLVVDNKKSPELDLDK